MKTMRRAIGLMSGTSMDGIDVALIDTDGETVSAYGPSGFAPYGEDDRALLRAALRDAAGLTDRAARTGVLAAAEARVTQRHAEAVEAFLKTHGIGRADVDVVGFHGQTVLHRPERGLTMQIGDGAGLAQRLGIDVIADFRAADMLAGGQGAPLVPVFHEALVRSAGLTGPALIVNIGGVSNVTFVSDDDAPPLACDTGPGNALLDDLMLERTGEALDRDGITAMAGSVDATALAALMDHPFFARPAPKSLDRNAFSRAAVDGLSTADAAATLTVFTAATLAGIVAHLPARPHTTVVCGGGARNPVLMAALATRLPGVIAADRLGWTGDAVEAQAFAFLAVRSLEGLPLTFPTTTGARWPVSGGVRHSAGRAAAAAAS